MRTIEFNKANLTAFQSPTFLKKLEEDNLESELQEEFLNYASADYIFPTNNFTSALHLCMCAIDLKRGDKIICSVNSSPEVPEVVRHFDAEPIFIDIKPDSSEMDFAEFEKVMAQNTSKKLKGIIISHIAGEILDISRIKNIVKDRQFAIIEDATNSIGLDRENLDSLSDIKVFSFDKKISNMGIFATDNEVFYNRAKLLSNHGIVMEEDAHLNYLYDVTDIGCQYTVPKMDLIYSMDSLEQVSSRLNIRKKIAKQYIENFKNTPHIEVSDFQQNHSYAQFVIRVDKNRDGFAKELKKVGIETELNFIPLHLLSYYKTKYNLKINSFPNALRNYQKILSIPIHSMLSQDDVSYIIKNVNLIANNRD